MASLPTPPRLGFRVPPPPAPRDPDSAGSDDGSLRTGDLIDGRYQIEECIGEGGVGVVYRAVQLKLHRRVAIKLLQQQSDDELRPRFEREAVTLAALSHPNIVSVQDYGHTRGKPYLVMELLAGRNLRELLDAEGALTVPRTLALMREILHALAYAHDLGIVHRDLKPANLLVQALPSHEHVKVLDFGFVKLLPGSYLDRGVQLSRVGFTFGTPAYMSPEHATGGDIDHRSDLYSVGILMFEMLTGTKPFEGELSELIRHHLATPIPRLAERRAELAGRADLQAIIDRAMTKPREGRFANAAEFLQAIEAAVTSAASDATPITPAKTAAAEPVSAPGTGFEQELRTFGAAIERFFRVTWALLKQRSGPALERALATSRTHLHKFASESERQARAFWARTKPQLVKLREQAQLKARELEARLQPKPALPAQAAPEVAKAGDPALSSTEALDELSEISEPPQLTVPVASSDSQPLSEQR